MSVLLLFHLISTAAILTCSVPNCLTCFPSSSLLCTQCLPGFTRSLSGCLVSPDSPFSLIENCAEYSFENICSSCHTGYTSISNICEPECPKDCLCFDPNNCLDVLNLQNFREKEVKRAVQSCPGNCTTCNENGTCSLCDTNFTLTNGSCCGSACENCNASSYCFSCKGWYYQKDGMCHQCYVGCAACTSGDDCSDCAPGYGESSHGGCASLSPDMLLVEILIPILAAVIIGIVLFCCCVSGRLRCDCKCLVKLKHCCRKTNKQKQNEEVEVIMEPPQIILNSNEINRIQGEIGMNVANFSIEQPCLEKIEGNNIIYTQMNPITFPHLALIVDLDTDCKYKGQDICYICQEPFRFDKDTRILPCMHVFHGYCAFASIAIANDKACPVCKRSYN